nr:MAG TPA: NinG protein [Caudoviricetes sp.]
MEKWICKVCSNEVFEKPRKNQLCGKNGCKGRFRHYSKCKDCGEWFLYGGANRTRCDSCSFTSGHKRNGAVTLVCAHCGEQFQRYSANVKSKNNYCSRDCMEKSKAAKKIRETCKWCGKVFYVYASSIETSNAAGKFCSTKCYHKSMTIDGERTYAGFQTSKKLNFKGKQFCAVCGGTRNIHIHHIIPNRLTHDQSKTNLIPLCAKHHPQIEAVTREFIAAMDGDIETAGTLLKTALRDRQFQTYSMLVALSNPRGQKAVLLHD